MVEAVLNEPTDSISGSMSEAPAHPLVTFALFAYNQREFIRLAVEGAFSQTYPALEIILSDDCSSDGTFDLMCQMAQEYRGPHKIILNRNEENLGVCAHVNKVFGLATGNFIVVAAGDDISLPDRTDHMVDAWRGCGVSAVYCESNLMDDKGGIIGYWALPTAKAAPERINCDGNAISVPFYGAGAAYDRKIFTQFGCLPVDVRNEDYNLAMRAALLNGVSYINKPLIHYRKHAANLSFWVGLSNTKGIRAKALIMAKQQENLINNQLHVFEYIKEHCGRAGLVSGFRDHMLSTRVRCSLLYVLGGKPKKDMLNSLGLSRLRLALRVVVELLALSLLPIRVWGSGLLKAVRPHLRLVVVRK